MTYLDRPISGYGSLVKAYTTRFVGKRMTIVAVLSGGKRYMVRPEGHTGTIKVCEDELTGQSSLDIPQRKGGQA